eukprot:4587996-Prymnesium_polylepis.1
MLLEDHPIATAIVRKCVIRIALRRAVVKMAAVKRSYNRQAGWDVEDLGVDQLAERMLNAQDVESAPGGRAAPRTPPALPPARSRHQGTWLQWTPQRCRWCPVPLLSQGSGGGTEREALSPSRRLPHERRR